MARAGISVTGCNEAADRRSRQALRSFVDEIIGCERLPCDKTLDIRPEI
jgi:hypothetical protein